MTWYDGRRVSRSTRGLGGHGSRGDGALAGLLGGTVLLLIWATLWTVFVLGVIQPAARFRAAAGTGASIERSGT